MYYVLHVIFSVSHITLCMTCYMLHILCCLSYVIDYMLHALWITCYRLLRYHENEGRQESWVASVTLNPLTGVTSGQAEPPALLTL